MWGARCSQSELLSPAGPGRGVTLGSEPGINAWPRAICDLGPGHTPAPPLSRPGLDRHTWPCVTPCPTCAVRPPAMTRPCSPVASWGIQSFEDQGGRGCTPPRGQSSCGSPAPQPGVPTVSLAATRWRCPTHTCGPGRGQGVSQRPEGHSEGLECPPLQDLELRAQILFPRCRRRLLSVGPRAGVRGLSESDRPGWGP